MKKAAYKLHLKKDDIVEVIAGKEKGKKGKILAIFPTQERVTVEKLKTRVDSKAFDGISQELKLFRGKREINHLKRL